MSQPSFPGGHFDRDPDLTHRQREVFAALVAMHGETAQPVGSESIGRRHRLPWSAASIRSTLAELEALGLLARSHSSAGRVPSASGYAFYVRRELTPAVLPDELRREVDERLRRASRDVKELLAEASRVLSRLTRQLGLAVTTPIDTERLADVELAPLGATRTLMALAVEGGTVHSLVLELDHPLERDELEEVASVMRERLVGLSLLQVRERLVDDDELVGSTAVRVVARAAAASWDRPTSATLFSAGAGEIAAQPEFADRMRLGSLLRVVESGPPLDRLMVGTAEGQPAVHVALDEDLALAGCSLISFPLSGRLPSAVGVLGPLRMNYARCVAVVDLVGSRVAEYS
jgi:heat-inducible transcriptional repressor